MPDRIPGHYERHAGAFDAARRHSFAERGWLDRLLAMVPAGGAILDLGCGGGEPIARHLIDAGRRVTGVDGAPSMIALARTRFPRQDWLCADMRSVAIDGQFEGVLAWDSLFHLPPADQTRMLARAAGWLAPGGVLLFNTGPAAGEAIGCQFDEPLYHASLSPADYRAQFAEHGLEEIAFAPSDAQSVGRSVWLVQKRG